MVADQIAHFLSEAKGLPADDVPGLETPLLQSGLIDSLGMVDLVAFIETTFGIQVDDEELVPENFETIFAIAGFVEHKRSKSAGRDV